MNPGTYAGAVPGVPGLLRRHVNAAAFVLGDQPERTGPDERLALAYRRGHPRSVDQADWTARYGPTSRRS